MHNSATNWCDLPYICSRWSFSQIYSDVYVLWPADPVCSVFKYLPGRNFAYLVQLSNTCYFRKWLVGYKWPSCPRFTSLACFVSLYRRKIQTWQPWAVRIDNKQMKNLIITFKRWRKDGHLLFLCKNNDDNKTAAVYTVCIIIFHILLCRSLSYIQQKVITVQRLKKLSKPQRDQTTINFISCSLLVYLENKDAKQPLTVKVGTCWVLPMRSCRPSPTFQTNSPAAAGLNLQWQLIVVSLNAPLFTEG